MIPFIDKFRLKYELAFQKSWRSFHWTKCVLDTQIKQNIIFVMNHKNFVTALHCQRHVFYPTLKSI
jgi:hypothetical protein